MTFTRAYLRVPTGTLQALRAAIADDSVARVQKLFDELVVGNEGVDIDTTVYAEEDGPHSLYVAFLGLAPWCFVVYFCSAHGSRLVRCEMLCVANVHDAWTLWMCRYYERLDGFHTRGNQCTILQFSLLQISPRVARWAVREQSADATLVYKIACPAIIPSGTRLRLKMSYVGVAELLAPSAGRYLTTKVRSWAVEPRCRCRCAC